jgi:hypothetical protein|tara:strand:+ start:12669 stop:13310 length:642 start_codon:yes stop_codon:yes gene_type:complete
MVKKQKSFKGVTLEYPITLIDTSALLHPLEGCPDKEDKSYQARILYSRISLNSSIFFRRFLEQRNTFYVTRNVLEEYTPEPLRKVSPSHGIKYLLFNERQRNDEKRRDFIELLRSNGNVIQLSEREQEYYSFFNRAHKDIMDRERLSETDSDLLISGVVVSKTRGATCLISNDFGILRSWKDLVRGGKIAPEEFGFFLRKEPDVFERANYPYR